MRLRREYKIQKRLGASARYQFTKKNRSGVENDIRLSLNLTTKDSEGSS